MFFAIDIVFLKIEISNNCHSKENARDVCLTAH